jgi:hypothetical protein
MKIHSRLLGDNACRRGLSRTGRAEKYHICNSSAFKHAAYDSTLSEKMLLSDYSVYALRTQKIRKLCVSHIMKIPFSC